MLLKVKKQDFIREIKSLLFVVLLAISIRSLVLEIFFVPTGSMKFSILENDYILSTKYSYGYSKYSFPFSLGIFKGRILANKPNRGDIVIFRPPHDLNIRYIKRLIGIPGDKLQIINDVIYINDVPIKREIISFFIGENKQKYVKYLETLPNNVKYVACKKAYNIETQQSNTKVYYIPKNNYFFLGDNRDDSRDSRFELGLVPFENFIAKAQYVIFSTKELLLLSDINIWQQILRMRTWFFSIRSNRILKDLYAIDYGERAY